ncbi:phage exclusion protein Lit family protein [Chitinophaga sancti]|uniref:phage exclusion protein Lit family protein n=1 Tax=Chitinophaga sancti TaxID=1004 RepID=UPI002A74F6FD|nr:phage exclusion protein Lit family protein [Chitinophaga sancti]WPQ66097.1 phage exclusion protein Lit family protein [Chitinophaga sancti]
MKNFFSDPDNLNENPIRVLRGNVYQELSRLSPSFIAVLRKAAAEGKLDPSNIQFSDSEYPATNGPAAGVGMVLLYDGFQMYLWCMCYCFVVYHSEMTVKRQANRDEENDDVMDGVDMEKLKTAMKLMEYAQSLLKGYHPWDISLPNPAYYSDEMHDTITKVNAVYLHAMNFVIAHEVAHIELDHVTDNAALDLTELDMEIQADARSVELIKDGMTTINKDTAELGVLAALCTLLLMKSELSGGGHPDSDDRIGAFIEHIIVDNHSHLWGIAVLAYRLWADHYGHGIFFFQNLDSAKLIYDEIRKQLKEETLVQYCEVIVPEGTYGVTCYDVGDRRQFYTKIDGFGVWFEADQLRGTVKPIMNDQYIDPTKISDFITALSGLIDNGSSGDQVQ